jgi:hypothetical protein
MSPVARPDTNSLFHIDPTWFEKGGRDLRVEMYAALCDECRAIYPTPTDARSVDRVHPQTGEVTRVDALWECLADHCAHKPEFITPATPLMSAIFRALLANENKPMSSEQLYKRIGKSNAAGILRVLLSADIENGVVPFEEKRA